MRNRPQARGEDYCRTDHFYATFKVMVYVLWSLTVSDDHHSCVTILQNYVFLSFTKKKRVSTFKSLGLLRFFNVFKEASFSKRLYLIAQKFSKNSNIEKY